MTLCKQIMSMMISAPTQTAWHKLHKKPKMAIWDKRNTGRKCHDRNWRENPKVIVTINYYNTLTLCFPSKNWRTILKYFGSRRAARRLFIFVKLFRWSPAVFSISEKRPLASNKLFCRVFNTISNTIRLIGKCRF